MSLYNLERKAPKAAAKQAVKRTFSKASKPKPTKADKLYGAKS